jgi:hypothetical protein
MTVSNYPGVNNQFVRIRGPLHGNQLLIQGQTATSTWFTAIFGGTFPTAGNFILSVYGVFSPFPAPGPTISVDSFEQFGSTNLAMNALLNGDSVTVPAAGLAIGPIISYTGPVTVICNTMGAFTVNPRLRAYTVANGTSTLFLYRLPQAFNNLETTASSPNAGYMLDMFLPAYFFRADLNNVSAVAGTASLLITGKQ